MPHTLAAQGLHSLTTISRLLTLVTTLYKSLTHRLMFPVIAFTALLGNVFQQRMFLCSQAHVLAGYLRTWLGVAMQQLTTVGAPPPPTPPPGVTVLALGCLGLPASELKLYSTLDLDWLACVSILQIQLACGPTVNTASRNSFVVAWHHYWREPTENTLPSHTSIGYILWCDYSTLVSLPLSSDGCLFRLNYSGFQQTCHNI
jgi:hypothetical protein